MSNKEIALTPQDTVLELYDNGDRSVGIPGVVYRVVLPWSNDFLQNDEGKEVAEELKKDLMELFGKYAECRISNALYDFEIADWNDIGDKIEAADYAQNWSTDQLSPHYSALVGDPTGLTREEIIKGLRGTEFDEFAYD